MIPTPRALIPTFPPPFHQIHSRISTPSHTATHPQQNRLLTIIQLFLNSLHVTMSSNAAHHPSSTKPEQNPWTCCNCSQHYPLTLPSPEPSPHSSPCPSPSTLSAWSSESTNPDTCRRCKHNMCVDCEHFVVCPECGFEIPIEQSYGECPCCDHRCGEGV
ncbi:hypothetical protein B9Z19DRAFT_1076169 [Tuber borchii]|uniref:Uncharacterized protein n=1 Tax=Tuber borchii TaxID=42251 RepID=A0A2T7A2C3_TUBBO|nr:hypothetical protein B9Z19DRAFT_1076169 [Tuber borchii]